MTHFKNNTIIKDKTYVVVYNNNAYNAYKKDNSKDIVN
jgi:hypothetical protein